MKVGILELREILTCKVEASELSRQLGSKHLGADSIKAQTPTHAMQGAACSARQLCTLHYPGHKLNSSVGYHSLRPTSSLSKLGGNAAINSSTISRVGFQSKGISYSRVSGLISSIFFAT